jgi:hypothetical protein
VISVAALRDVVPAAVDVDAGILEEMILRAREFVEKQTNRYFGEPGEVPEYLYGKGSRWLQLLGNFIPSTDEYGVTVEERAYPGGTATLISDTEYSVRESAGNYYLVRSGGLKWTDGYEYAITYNRGYEIDAGPRDVQQLVIDLIAVRLNALGKDGIQSESSGGYSYTKFAQSDLQGIAGGNATINAWRRLVLA